MNLSHLLFSYQGRINRAKFWAGVGIVLVGWLVYAGLAGVLTGGNERAFLTLIAIAYLPMFYVALAIYVKRWHDRDKSGWWTLIMLVPLVGPIWLLVELGCLEGTPGPNRFGADPLNRAPLVPAWGPGPVPPQFGAPAGYGPQGETAGYAPQGGAAGYGQPGYGQPGYGQAGYGAAPPQGGYVPGQYAQAPVGQGPSAPGAFLPPAGAGPAYPGQPPASPPPGQPQAWTPAVPPVQVGRSGREGPGTPNR